MLRLVLIAAAMLVSSSAVRVRPRGGPGSLLPSGGRGGGVQPTQGDEEHHCCMQGTRRALCDTSQRICEGRVCGGTWCSSAGGPINSPVLELEELDSDTLGFTTDATLADEACAANPQELIGTQLYTSPFMDLGEIPFSFSAITCSRLRALEVARGTVDKSFAGLPESMEWTAQCTEGNCVVALKSLKAAVATASSSSSSLAQALSSRTAISNKRALRSRTTSLNLIAQDKNLFDREGAMAGTFAGAFWEFVDQQVQNGAGLVETSLRAVRNDEAQRATAAFQSAACTGDVEMDQLLADANIRSVSGMDNDDSVYSWDAFCEALQYFDSVPNLGFFRGSTKAQYAANIASLLSQCMWESGGESPFSACDENNYRGTPDASCTQRSDGMLYHDLTGPGACPLDPEMHIIASTAAEWSVGPLECTPDTLTENCCWWGRGAIQTTGPANYGPLQSQVVDNIPALAHIDLCSNPGQCLMCSDETLKWFGALYFWGANVQNANADPDNSEDIVNVFHQSLVDYATNGFKTSCSVVAEADFPSGCGGVVNNGGWSKYGGAHNNADRVAYFELLMTAFKDVGLEPDGPEPADGESCVKAEADCAGVANGDAAEDACGVCQGDGSSCADCAGVPNGNAVEDACGVCQGDGSSCAVFTYASLRCATSWEEGNTQCGTPCPSGLDSECIYEGETCFSGLSEAVQCDGWTNAQLRCGPSWVVANSRCGQPCPGGTNSECEIAGETCFSGLDESVECQSTEASDCAGTVGGSATEDNCGVCDADPSNDCTQDCADEWGGSATEDNCGVCDADPSNDCTQDCADEWGGSATEDNCGVCDADPSNDCAQDCADEWGGSATEDNCGVCDADPSNDCAQDCAGEWGGSATEDDCGVCEGDGTTCTSGSNNDGSVQSVVAGQGHSCAILNDGSVRCWGGGPAYDDLNNPPGDGKFTSITGFGQFLCGIIQDTDEVACWGWPSFADDQGRLDPPEGVQFEQISSHYVHSCGIVKDSDGEMKCWGLDSAGNLDVPAGVQFTQASAGFRFSCGIVKETAEAMCWGAPDSFHLDVPTGVQPVVNESACIRILHVAVVCSVLCAQFYKCMEAGGAVVSMPSLFAFAGSHRYLPGLITTVVSYWVRMRWHVGEGFRSRSQLHLRGNLSNLIAACTHAVQFQRIPIKFPAGARRGRLQYW